MSSHNRSIDDGTLQPIDLVLGGVVDPDSMVGRQGELLQLTRAVAHGGGYVTGDRRMGKTTLLRTAKRALEASSHVVIMLSGETDELAGFTEALEAAIRSHPQLGKSWSEWSKSIEGQAKLKVFGSGFRVSGTATRSVSNADPEVFALCAEAARKLGAPRLVLMVDEIAQLVFNMQLQEPGSGAELLRSFRRLRQSDNPRVSVVLAGSVGLHHAVTEATALNDLPRIAVGPLPHDQGVELARRLLLGVYQDDAPDLATRIAEGADSIPFYIHCIVSELTQRTGDPRQVDLGILINESLDTNRWDTDHYYERLFKYFPNQEQQVIALLDEIAHQGPLDRAALTRMLANRDPLAAPNSAAVGELLRLLALDHYLRYDDGDYSFTSAFLRQVWIRLRWRRG